MKRGQMKMSFGMIFSIILIIIFIAFAFYAIKLFIGFGKNVTEKSLASNLQDDVNIMWRNAGSQQYTYTVPSGTQYVCFIDFNSPGGGENQSLYGELKYSALSFDGNLMIYAGNPTNSYDIQNIDLVATTGNSNPLCFTPKDGKITLTLKKGFSDAQVTVER